MTLHLIYFRVIVFILLQVTQMWSFKEFEKSFKVYNEPEKAFKVLLQYIVDLRAWTYKNHLLINSINPASNYMFKVNNGNTRIRYEICSKLTIKTPERRQWYPSGVFVKSEHISHLVLVFLLLTLSSKMSAGNPLVSGVHYKGKHT